MNEAVHSVGERTGADTTPLIVRPNHLLSAYAIVMMAGVAAAAGALLVVGLAMAWLLAPLGLAAPDACDPLKTAIPLAGLGCGVLYLGVTALLPPQGPIRLVGWVAISTIVASAYQIGTVAGAPSGWIGCAAASSAVMSGLFPLALLGVLRVATGSATASVSSAGLVVSLIVAAIAIGLASRYAAVSVASAPVALLLVTMLVVLSALTVLAWAVGTRPRAVRPGWFGRLGLLLIAMLIAASVGTIAVTFAG